MTWSAGGGGSPGGANTQVQFNNAGAFGGAAGFTFNGTAALTLGVASTTRGSLVLANTSANSATIVSSNSTASAWTLTLPTGPGTANQTLQTDGTGITSWASPSASSAAGGTFGVGTAGTTTGSLDLYNASSSFGVAIQSANNAAAWTLTLPIGPGTAGQFLQTNGAGVTSWASASGSGTVNSGTANQIAFYSATGTAVSGNANVTASTGALTLGVAGTAAGSVVLSGSASGTVTINTAAAAGAWTMTLPTTAGTAGQVLKTDGTGITSWQADSAAAGGATTQVQYNNAGSLAGAAGFTFNGTSTVALGVAGTSTGTLTLAGSSSGVVTVKPAAAAGTWSLTLPTTAGTASQVLQTDGSGNTSWVTISGSGTVNSGTANQMAFYSATGTAVSGNANVTVSTGALTLGVAGTAAGSLVLSGSGSGAVTINTAAAAGTWSLTLPTTAGTSGGLLQTNGSGVTSWTTPVSGSLVGTTGTQTLTNKRITPRVSSAASITSPLAVNSDNFDQYCATAQAANLTISADAGTPTDGQRLIFRFLDNGTPRTLTWTSGALGYRAVGITLPTTTTASKTTYVGFIYNAASNIWDGVATSTEA
jgi:hypothetical protein